MSEIIGWDQNREPEERSMAHIVVWSAIANVGPGASAWTGPSMLTRVMTIGGRERRIEDVLSMNEVGVEALGCPDAPAYTFQIGHSRTKLFLGEKLYEYKPEP